MPTSKTPDGLPGRRRRRSWTAAKKEAVLRAFAASGQSATAFCRATGLPRATLTLWRRTARAAPAAVAPATFARVELVSAAARAAAGPSASGPAARLTAPLVLPLTLALRVPGGLEAVLTGLDVAAAVTVLRGVLPTAAAAP